MKKATLSDFLFSHGQRLEQWEKKIRTAKRGSSVAFFQSNCNIFFSYYLNDLYLTSCDIVSYSYRSVMLSYLQDLPASRGDIQDI